MLIRIPVVLLIYNRPEYTEKVFSAIERVEPESLFIIADGPKDDSDLKNCEKTRAIVEKINWKCSIQTNYSEHNLGLKNRISSGLDWVFSQVEEAIILEDDCVPSESFFGFCQTLLDRYRDDERVMMIAGSNFLPDLKIAEESYFFSRYFSIWGWATWGRAWEKYDITMSNWRNFRKKGFIKSLYRQRFAAEFLGEMIEDTYQGKIDTWDIQWFYTCLINHGLSIVPNVNLVSNIGFVGVHSQEIGQNQAIPVDEINLRKITHPEIICPNPLYDEEFLRRNFADTDENGLNIYKRIKLFEKKIRKALQNIRSDV